MTLKQIKTYCESLPHSEATFPFDETTLVYKVAGKMYILVATERKPLSINVKVDPEQGIEWRARFSSITEGYHMDKKHWITIMLDGEVPAEVVQQIISDSYTLVFAKLPKKTRDLLANQPTSS